MQVATSVGMTEDRLHSDTSLGGSGQGANSPTSHLNAGSGFEPCTGRGPNGRGLTVCLPSVGIGMKSVASDVYLLVAVT